MEETKDITQEQKNHFDKQKVLDFLTTLAAKLKDLNDRTQEKIKMNESDYEHVTKKFKEWKEESIKITNELSTKIFAGPLNLEELVPEWYKHFKSDPEITQQIHSNISLMSEWKMLIKKHIANSPLINIQKT